MIKTIILIVLSLAMSFSYGGTIRPDVSDEKYIKYGNEYKCVVKLSGKLKNGNSIAVGSAVVIQPNWVITAAHVVQCTENQQIIIDEKKYQVIKVISHKDFDENKNSSNADIALCYVEEKIDLDFYPKLYDKEDELDKVCGISGYGLTGTGLTGAHKMDEKKRAGSNKISSVSDDLLMCDMSKNNPTELEFLIAHGDSGGGLFIDKKLAGINSFVSSTDKPDSSYGDESWHTRISKYKSWIEENIKGCESQLPTR